MSFTRRQLLNTFVVSASALAASSLVGCGNSRSSEKKNGGHFPQSVMTGDPTPESLIFWTRIDDNQDTRRAKLHFWVKGNNKDSKVTPIITTNAKLDGIIKIKIVDLMPNTQYEYFFEYLDTTDEKRRYSNTGLTKTAPTKDADQDVRFAFASCQDFNGRYYNAYVNILNDKKPFDFLVHLGDYIYETTGDPGFQSVVQGDRSIDFEDQAGAIQLHTKDGSVYYAAQSLSNYRQLYKAYRSDPILQKVHEKMPMIAIWDDHEFSDDSYAEHATYFNGLDDSADKSKARKHNSERAYFEYMPIDCAPYTEITLGNNATQHRSIDPSKDLFPYTKVYRQFDFGTRLSLFMSDTRSFRQDHLIPEGALASRAGVQSADLESIVTIIEKLAPSALNPSADNHGKTKKILQGLLPPSLFEALIKTGVSATSAAALKDSVRTSLFGLLSLSRDYVLVRNLVTALQTSLGVVDKLLPTLNSPDALKALALAIKQAVAAKISVKDVVVTEIKESDYEAIGLNPKELVTSAVSDEKRVAYFKKAVGLFLTQFIDNVMVSVTEPLQKQLAEGKLDQTKVIQLVKKAVSGELTRTEDTPSPFKAPFEKFMLHAEVQFMDYIKNEKDDDIASSVIPIELSQFGKDGIYPIESFVNDGIDPTDVLIAALAAVSANGSSVNLGHPFDTSNAIKTLIKKELQKPQSIGVILSFLDGFNKAYIAQAGGSINGTTNTALLSNQIMSVVFDRLLKTDFVEKFTPGIPFAALGHINQANEIGSRYLVIKDSFDLLALIEQFKALLPRVNLSLQEIADQDASNLINNLTKLLMFGKENPGEAKQAASAAALSSMLGNEQYPELAKFTQSPAKWKILGSSISSTPLVADFKTNYADRLKKLFGDNIPPAYVALAAAMEKIVQELPALYHQRFYVNVDQWDGFPAAKQALQELLAYKDVIAIAGDIHSAYASTFNSTQSNKTLVELTAPSISSLPLAGMLDKGLAGVLKSAKPNISDEDLEKKINDFNRLYNGILQAAPKVAEATDRLHQSDIQLAETNQHGLVVMEAGKDAIKVEYRLVAAQADGYLDGTAAESLYGDDKTEALKSVTNIKHFEIQKTAKGNTLVNKA